MRVYRARERYTPGAKFSTWLFTIANNAASNARRTLARRREVQVETTESGSMDVAHLALAGSGQMPTRQLDKTEMRDVVQLAITALNDRQRLAVLLSRFEEMSYADIAEVMQLTPQAVKSLLARARTSLRQTLEPYLQHGVPPETART